MGPLDAHQAVALLVAAATLAGVAFGRLPFVPLDRAGFALVGAALLLATGVVDLDTAAALVDTEVMVLLFGLMLLNEVLAEAGAFRALTRWATRRAHRPWALLAALTVAAGALSALFLNDTVVLMLTPLVVQLTRRLGVAPVPYLLALATGANVGSVATVTGNPQNLVVSVMGPIDYRSFVAALAPVAAIGLLVVVAVVALAHRGALAGPPFAARPLDEPLPPRRPLALALGWAALLVVAFAAGAPVAVAALVVGAGVVLTAGAAGARAMARVDLSLLALFAGLFVVVGALGHTGVLTLVAEAAGAGWTRNVGALTAVAAVASNLVSNVPAVLMLAPLVVEADGGRVGLLTLAMASTLAGNLTIVGSVANLIVVESARKLGVTIGFWAYLRVGLPITIATLAIGAAWLAFGPVPPLG
jgi:Na+/H+ antiporter NhaD/arsenite permease-like protein